MMRHAILGARGGLGGDGGGKNSGQDNELGFHGFG